MENNLLGRLPYELQLQVTLFMHLLVGCQRCKANCWIYFFFMLLNTILPNFVQRDCLNLGHLLVLFPYLSFLFKNTSGFTLAILKIVQSWKTEVYFSWHYCGCYFPFSHLLIFVLVIHLIIPWLFFPEHFSGVHHFLFSCSFCCVSLVPMGNYYGTLGISECIGAVAIAPMPEGIMRVVWEF